MNTLADDLPEGPWRDLHEFQLVETGEIFRVSVWSLDDDLGLCVHAVIDGALKELTLIQHHGREWTSRREERIVLDNLQPAPDR